MIREWMPIPPVMFKTTHARGWVRDLLILCAFVIVGAVLSIRFNIFETFVTWSRAHEAWQLDEILIVSIFAAAGTGLAARLRRLEYLREVDRHEQSFVSLEESEKKWRLMFESAASGVAIVSMKDGRLVAANRAACDSTGYTEEELTSMTITDLMHPDDQEASIERIRRMLTGELPWARSRVRYLHRDGHTRYALVSSAPLGATEGQPGLLVTHVLDITEQVLAEQRLHDLMEAKDQLIASVSHEIRTPLTAVVGYAQLLNGDVSHLTDPERKEMVATIANEGADLADIVEDLLVEARADSGVLMVANVSVDLQAQTRQVMEALDRETTGDRIGLVGSTVRAMADPARVRQIIRNLISNAIRYGGEEIRVAFHGGPTYVSLTVSDNGPGVPLEEREEIFEPYHRAHTRPGLTASIGLGLSVSRKLARLMDGELVYTYNDGWSVFRLELPATL
jgi:PAS domain S-box-containing protein